MRICFFHSDKPRERLLADAFADGVRLLGRGDEVHFRALTPEPQVADAEVAVMIGVKSRELYKANWSAGVHCVMVDKGYSRHATRGPVKLWEYWRVAIDAHHPTEYLMDMDSPSDRWDRLGLQLVPPRRSGKHILIAGSSAKYHQFYGLKEPTNWTIKLVQGIRARTDRPILYRPKPSWSDAVPIEGTEYSGSRMTLEQALIDCHVMITHGSNACFEATLAGIPTIVLGEAVAKPISSTSLDDIVRPPFPTERQRLKWAHNIAYCQWTMPEFASGIAWEHIRPRIFGTTPTQENVDE